MLTCVDCGHTYHQSVWNFNRECENEYGFENISEANELATYRVSWVVTCPFCGKKRYARELYVCTDVMFGAEAKDKVEGEE